jgi:hypothetical protein
VEEERMTERERRAAEREKRVEAFLQHRKQLVIATVTALKQQKRKDIWDTEQKRLHNQMIVNFAKERLGDLSNKSAAVIDAENCNSARALVAGGMDQRNMILVNRDPKAVGLMSREMKMCHCVAMDFAYFLLGTRESYDIIYYDACGGLRNNDAEAIESLFTRETLSNNSLLALTFIPRAQSANIPLLPLPFEEGMRQMMFKCHCLVNRASQKSGFEVEKLHHKQYTMYFLLYHITRVQ